MTHTPLNTSHANMPCAWNHLWVHTCMCWVQISLTWTFIHIIINCNQMKQWNEAKLTSQKGLFFALKSRDVHKILYSKQLVFKNLFCVSIKMEKMEEMEMMWIWLTLDCTTNKIIVDVVSNALIFITIDTIDTRFYRLFTHYSLYSIIIYFYY